MDPLTGDKLRYFDGELDENEDLDIYCNLRECWETNNTAPVAQFMLDLLHKDFNERQLLLDNPLNEVPDSPELYVSREWLDHRGMNRGHFPGMEKTDIADLATESYIYNLQRAERHTPWDL